MIGRHKPRSFTIHCFAIRAHAARGIFHTTSPMSRSTCGNMSARYEWSRQLSKRFVRRLASPSWWLSLIWINAICESFLVTHSAHTHRYRSCRPSVTQKTCLASTSRPFLGAIVLPTQQCCTTHSLPITNKKTTTTAIRASCRSCTFC